MKNEVEKIYNEFWKDIVEKNGQIDMEQVKKELFDFYFVMHEVPKVYEHVTGGITSRILVPADTVIAFADDHINELVDDLVKDSITSQKTSN